MRWGIRSFGIASAEMLFDGVSLGPARIGLDPPGSRSPPILAFDPAYPNVQLDYDLPAQKMTPGVHRLQLRALRKDGGVLTSDERIIYVP